jgi:hypothetical protein
MFGEVRGENQQMRAFCRSLGFTEASHPDDVKVRRVRLAVGASAHGEDCGA